MHKQNFNQKKRPQGRFNMKLVLLLNSKIKQNKLNRFDLLSLWTFFAFTHDERHTLTFG